MYFILFTLKRSSLGHNLPLGNGALHCLSTLSNLPVNSITRVRKFADPPGNTIPSQSVSITEFEDQKQWPSWFVLGKKMYNRLHGIINFVRDVFKFE